MAAVARAGEHLRHKPDGRGEPRTTVPTKRDLSELEATPQANVFPGGEPKTVRLALDAGGSVPRHDHPDRRVVFHVLEGEIDLTVGESSHELEVGHVVQFDGARPVSMDAITDGRALVVLARKPETETETKRT